MSPTAVFWRWAPALVIWVTLASFVAVRGGSQDPWTMITASCLVFAAVLATLQAAMRS